jgi:hypothetical protein
VLNAIGRLSALFLHPYDLSAPRSVWGLVFFMEGGHLITSMHLVTRKNKPRLGVTADEQLTESSVGDVKQRGLKAFERLSTLFHLIAKGCRGKDPGQPF